MEKEKSIKQFVIQEKECPLSHPNNANNHFYLTEDGSLMYTADGGDYSVLLGGNWRYELIVNSSTGLCVKFQSFLDELTVYKKNIEIPHFVQKNIYFKNNDALAPYEGCHYIPFDDGAYWDPEKHILCIGNPNKAGEAIEFTKKIIAVVNNNEMTCIYLLLNDVKDIDCFLIFKSETNRNKLPFSNIFKSKK